MDNRVLNWFEYLVAIVFSVNSQQQHTISLQFAGWEKTNKQFFVNQSSHTTQ